MAIWNILHVLAMFIAFGFTTAASEGFSLTSKWLVTTYLLAALLIVVGIGLHQRWMRRLVAAAAASPEDHASAELMAVINDKIVRAAGPVSGLLWIALIALMVLKPA